jgi:hypothetical protein
MGVTRISFTIRVFGHALSVIANHPAYPVSIVLRVLLHFALLLLSSFFACVVGGLCHAFLS